MSLINPSLEVIYCSNLAFNYSIIMFIRFVSPFTDSSRNAFFISSRFKSPCRCRIFFFEILVFETKHGPRFPCELAASALASESILCILSHPGGIK